MSRIVDEIANMVNDGDATVVVCSPLRFGRRETRPMAARPPSRELTVVIRGCELPGRTWCRPEGGDYENVHVGRQHRADPVDLVPGDASEAVWMFPIVLKSSGLDVDFGGPNVHGRTGERFIYLTWGAVAGGHFEMFRRAKLRLDALPAAVVAALPGAATLRGELSLTGGDDGPLCASIRPPLITWTTET